MFGSPVLYHHSIAAGQLWPGVERAFLWQIINEMQRKARHPLMKTSAHEKCSLPTPQMPFFCIWACGILHVMYCVAPHAAPEPLLCLSDGKVQLKEPVTLGQSQVYGLTWPASLNFVQEMREVSSDLTMTLCPDFQMALMLPINLETSHLRGSQPGLNSPGVTKAVGMRALRVSWVPLRLPSDCSGQHFTSFRIR